MEELIRQFQQIEGIEPVLRSAIILLLGLPALFGAVRLIRRWVSSRYSAQQAMVVAKILYLTGLLLILVTVLAELGFSMAPLLGAAGIFGIAIGFASQTVASNLISGFFLIGEQPFVVGDLIEVGQTRGFVLSIDMLSVKLRTFDNKMVRIPNEQLVKTEMTTITRFPIRRVDMPIGIAYREDVGRVRELLLEIADEHPQVLIEPAPMVMFQGFGSSSVDLNFVVWTVKENFLTVKNEILEEVKARFDAEDVEIPFPHTTVYAGSVTEPMPIRLIGDAPAATPEEMLRAMESDESAGDAG